VLVCTLPLLLTRADKCTVDPCFLTFRTGLKTVAFNLSGRAFSNAEPTGGDMSRTHLSLPTSLTTENDQQPSRSIFYSSSDVRDLESPPRLHGMITSWIHCVVEPAFFDMYSSKGFPNSRTDCRTSTSSIWVATNAVSLMYERSWSVWVLNTAEVVA